jgi:hypothetical protein
MISGHIDLISADLIEGWLYLPPPLHPARLEVLDGPTKIGICRAELPRADLADYGACAFSFLVPLHQSVKNPDTLRLRLAGTPLYLLADPETRIELADPGP